MLTPVPNPKPLITIKKRLTLSFNIFFNLPPNFFSQPLLQHLRSHLSIALLDLRRQRWWRILILLIIWVVTWFNVQNATILWRKAKPWQHTLLRHIQALLRVIHRRDLVFTLNILICSHVAHFILLVQNNVARVLEQILWGNSCFFCYVLVLLHVKNLCLGGGVFVSSDWEVFISVVIRA